MHSCHDAPRPARVQAMEKFTMDGGMSTVYDYRDEEEDPGVGFGEIKALMGAWAGRPMQALPCMQAHTHLPQLQAVYAALAGRWAPTGVLSARMHGCVNPYWGKCAYPMSRLVCAVAFGSMAAARQRPAQCACVAHVALRCACEACAPSSAGWR